MRHRRFVLVAALAACAPLSSANPAGCTADFNGDTIVNTMDVIAFLNAYAAGDPAADLNGDTNVNTLDVIAFLNAYTAGCGQDSVVHVVFNGGVTGNASPFFTRANPARGPDGVPYDSDQIRWDTERAVFGATQVEIVDDEPVVYTVKSAGMGAGGVPIVVYRKGVSRIVVRNAETLDVLSSTWTQNAPSHFVKPDAMDDMMRGQQGEEEDHGYNPRGHAFVHDGLIVIQCGVWTYKGYGDRTNLYNWSRRGTGAVYSIDNGASWKVHYRGPEEGYPGLRTNEWSGCAFPTTRMGFTPGDSVPDLIVAHADYRIDVKDGASAYLGTFRRVGGVWTPGVVHRQTYPDPGGRKTHLHILTVFRDPANPDGLRVIWSIGDGRPYNVTLETRVASLDWTDSYPVDGAVNVVGGCPAFVGPQVIGGAATGDVATSLYADQPISIAPAFAANEYALGNDEGMSAVLRAVPPPNAGDPLQLRASHTLPTLSFDSGNLRVFQLHAQSLDAANPAVVGLLTPGGRFVNPDTGGVHDAIQRCPRVICKPENESAWGVLHPLLGETNVDNQRRPAIDPLGWVWLSTGEPFGLRRFKVPPSRVVRGAFAGPGGTNHARSTWSQVSAPASGNAVIPGYTLQDAEPASDAPVARMVSGGVQLNMGRYRVTHATVPRPHTNLWLVSSVGPVLWDGVNSTTHASQYHRVRLNSAEDGTGGQNTPYRGTNRVEAEGSYTVLWQRYVSGGVDWNTANISTDPFTVTVQPQFGDGSAHEGDAAVQFAMVLVDPPTPPSYMLPTAGSGVAWGDHETLYVPVSCNRRWHALVSLVLHSRDPFWHDQTTYRPVVAFWENAQNMIVVEHNGSRGIRARIIADGVEEAQIGTTLEARLLRTDPLHLAVSSDNGACVVRLSVAGSPVLTLPATWGKAIQPTRVYLGSDGSTHEAVVCLALKVNETRSASAEQLEAALRSLDAFVPPP
ncbi:MAG: hypothetical protein KIS87_03250 [Phycisphaeraceae bacterium]|nr:hypothetical protein [Phycisphaeraceae bacterium]